MKSLLILPVVFLATVRAGSMPPMTSPDAATPSQPFFDRLTAHWGGRRSRLGEHGISFDLDSTHAHAQAPRAPEATVTREGATGSLKGDLHPKGKGRKIKEEYDHK